MYTRRGVAIERDSEPVVYRAYKTIKIATAVIVNFLGMGCAWTVMGLTFEPIRSAYLNREITLSNSAFMWFSGCFLITASIISVLAVSAVGCYQMCDVDGYAVIKDTVEASEM